jgi:hypothetical protein
MILGQLFVVGCSLPIEKHNEQLTKQKKDRRK